MILIITQKIDKNDDILGFFHDWIEEFLVNTEKVFVISQFVGEYDLSGNVKVFSLGKEKGYSKTRQLFNFYRLLFKNLSKVDAVFVHMVSLWVVLGSPLFRIYGKNVYLWYTHKSVNLMLRLAERIATKIFTASRKSFRLKSKKVIITGHGIDTEKFKNQELRFKNETFKIITAGRIAVIKNLDILIRVAEILRERNLDFEIKIAGAPILEQDKVYFEKLQDIIREKKLSDKINFVGRISHKNVVEFYHNADLFVNLSDTGSIDKSILEAMSCGLLILTSNEAFHEILAEQYLTSKNPQEIAQKIVALSGAEPDSDLREYVVKNHSLENLIPKIINVIEQN